MRLFNNISVYIYMLISSASISLSTFFAKICIMSHVPVAVTVFARFFIPFIMLIVIFVSIDFFSRISWIGFRAYLIRALCLLLSQILLYFSITKLTLSEALILYNTGPIFIAIFDIFSGHKFSSKDAISLLLGLIGAALMLNVQNGAFNLYIITGLLSGFMLAASQILLHKSSRKDHNLNVMFFIYFFTSIFAFIPVAFFKSASEISLSSLNLYIVIALMLSGIFSFTNQFFRGKAYSLVVIPSMLSPLIYFSVLVSVILDLLYFKIFPNIEIILGGTFIIFSSYLSSTRKQPNAK